MLINITRKNFLPLCQNHEDSSKKKIYVEMVRSSWGKQQMHSSANSFQKIISTLDLTGSYEVSSFGFQNLVSAITRQTPIQQE